MGICVSCDVAAEAATAKVVLPGGELREYSPPATAASVLDACGGEHFVCDADAVGFEGALAATGRGEELRPGQIYFVLPAKMLRRRLTLEEVAALAVKASDALAKAAAGDRRRRRGAVAPLVFPEPEEEREEVVAPARKAAGRRSAGRRGGRHFSPDLTAIPESEE